MYLSSTVGLLLITVVVTSAIPKPFPFKSRDFTKLFDLSDTGNAHKHVQKRQFSEACLEAYQETQSPQFAQCTQLLSNGNLTTDDLVAFCNRYGCTSLLVKVFTDLESCQTIDEDNTTVSSEH